MVVAVVAAVVDAAVVATDFFPNVMRCLPIPVSYTAVVNYCDAADADAVMLLLCCCRLWF